MTNIVSIREFIRNFKQYKAKTVDVRERMTKIGTWTPMYDKTYDKETMYDKMYDKMSDIVKTEVLKGYKKTVVQQPFKAVCEKCKLPMEKEFEFREKKYCLECFRHLNGFTNLR